jgi:Phage tail lysozyme
MARTATADILCDGVKVGVVTVGDAIDVSPDPLGEGSGLAGAPSPGAFPTFRHGIGPGHHVEHGPTFRHNIGPGHRQREQEAHDQPHEKHGPTFRGKYQPRGSADPAKPEHFTTGDVQAAVKGEGTKTGKAGVASDVVRELRKGGASDSTIAGILANVTEESNFDPTLRHPDQPHYSGEAHYAHGLYQEGGAEWNHYAAWLEKNHPGARWQDPKLQTEFLAGNLKANYPAVWSRMQSGNKEQAAEAFASGYLKPAANYLASRLSKFRGRGVPDVGHYTGGPVGAPVGTTRLGPGSTPKAAPTKPALQEYVPHVGGPPAAGATPIGSMPKPSSANLTAANVPKDWEHALPASSREAMDAYSGAYSLLPQGIEAPEELQAPSGPGGKKVGGVIDTSKEPILPFHVNDFMTRYKRTPQTIRELNWYQDIEKLRKNHPAAYQKMKRYYDSVEGEH